MVIAPIALFIAVLYALNKLNGDSELIVMSAAGLSPLRLLRPFAMVTVLVTLLVGTMSLYVMPWSFRELRDLVMKIRADFITHVVREGTFTTLDQGFIFHYRERGRDGSLHGILMEDRRDPAHISSYVAESGQTWSSDDNNYLVLNDGSIQRHQPGSKDAAIVAFQRYALDLAQFGSEGDGAPLRPRERSTRELMHPDLNDANVKFQEGRFRSELHDRFSGPLYALAFGMIAFAALSQPRTTRSGNWNRHGGGGRWRWRRCAGPASPPRASSTKSAAWVPADLRRAAGRAGGCTARSSSGPSFRLAALEGCVRHARSPGRMSSAVVGRTFARYLSRNFARSILVVFGLLFAIIYLIDFVELLRRAGDAKGATTARRGLPVAAARARHRRADLPLLGPVRRHVRVPQPDPEARTRGGPRGRRVGLAVHPAARSSVALVLGMVTTTVYNPHRRRLEAARRPARDAHLRQDRHPSRSTRPSGSSRTASTARRSCAPTGPATAATMLSGITAFVYDRDGSFMERVEAEHGGVAPRASGRSTTPACWRPASRRATSSTDLIATNITAEQVQQKFVAPGLRAVLGAARRSATDREGRASTPPATSCNIRSCWRGRCCSWP